jgi:branched-chain amino acid transport system substrate-binding protein
VHHLPVTRLLGASVLLSVLGLAACSDDNTAAPPPTETVAATTTVHPDDGALVIGAILPSSGSAAELGASMSDALAVALTEINNAGGVNGRTVRLINREEGNNPATAGLAVQDLVQLGVDAIIGPTSSIDTLGTLGAAVEAGVLTCSPTASALALDSFPDKGLFFRTVPSDSLEAVAIAKVVELSGSRTATVVYFDDDYGRPFAEAAQAAMTAQGTNVSATVAFTSQEDSISAAVEEVLANKPDVVAVIADGTTGPAIINAIDGASTSRLTFVVNDAMRRPATSAQPFTPGLAQRVVGVSPLAYADSAPFTAALQAVDAAATGLYAHNAYDCLNIIALAALASASNQPTDIAGSIASVTTSGTGCTMFDDCHAALVEGRNIDYDGPTGNLEIDDSGNVVATDFERFTFDATGRDVADGELAIGNG